MGRWYRTVLDYLRSSPKWPIFVDVLQFRDPMTYARILDSTCSPVYMASTWRTSSNLRACRPEAESSTRNMASHVDAE
jgi:hypothetical protein